MRDYRPQSEKTRLDKVMQAFAQTRLGGKLFITVFPAIDRKLMALTRGKLSFLTAALSVGVLALAADSAPAATPPPPGANVPCQPTTAHPFPVVLVHGTAENMFDNWQAMSPALKAAGYCVYAFNYGSYQGSGDVGIYGINFIEQSAKELASEVGSVLRETKARKVDLVGHSQGGMMPRYYIKNLGGGPKVDDLVGISPSNHGTTHPLANPLGPICPACAQQAAGSPFITALNSGDETPGRVDYTNLATRYDEVVTPYTSAFLASDGNAVTNITLQDKCPNDTSDHLATPYDPPAIAITLNALGRSGPADPAYQPPCSG
ncbi:MAG TPA: alpha/beta fold hydrolase [Solirubrobacteraceae bacterium]|jgi:triacylglycerol lipase